MHAHDMIINYNLENFCSLYNGLGGGRDEACTARSKGIMGSGSLALFDRRSAYFTRRKEIPRVLVFRGFSLIAVKHREPRSKAKQLNSGKLRYVMAGAPGHGTSLSFLPVISHFHVTTFLEKALRT